MSLLRLTSGEEPLELVDMLQDAEYGPVVVTFEGEFCTGVGPTSRWS